MATIVWHKPSGRKYLFLGPGFGAYKAQRAGVLGGDWFPHEESGEIMVAAVCDGNGIIRWFPSEELQVLEIDGKPVSSWFESLADPDVLLTLDKDDACRAEAGAVEQCPACLTRVRAEERECPSCGLTLMTES
ncbi:hypothetical protein SAMN04487970_1011124 [Paenibacillus tianmuensis]|uniref:Zinc ribbon domain-containing protein n=1 Tax=Paenibacillus tianmuensis TaxID=624147 RepID=A0A1G4R3J5_9BACL|nr:hypothetical protein [Paenibacillus tianmuensis]SCW51414.1 hypothetical protein SAMN04487970_1011124 [Paenibacillus tianmuensis]